MLGMHGTRTANYAMDEADLICAIGARFDDRITGKLAEFASASEVHPHRHRFRLRSRRNVPAHIPIVGDAKKVLPKLTREYRALETESFGASTPGGSGSTAGRRSIRSATTTPWTPRSAAVFMIEAMYEATNATRS